MVVLRKQPDLKLQKRYGMSFVCTLWVQTRTCFDSSCHWVGCFFFSFLGVVFLSLVFLCFELGERGLGVQVSVFG